MQQEITEAAEVILQAMSDGAKLTGSLFGDLTLEYKAKQYEVPRAVVDHLERQGLLSHRWHIEQPRPVPPPRAVYALTA